MIALGIDTSCYTTSAALADERGILCSKRQLLPVRAGDAGLRQSDGVFLHSRQLPELLERLFSDAPCRPDCVCASAAPRADEGSYMPVFLVGAGTGRSIAAALGVPFFATNHQAGHLRAARVDSGLEADAFLALHLSGGTTDVLLCEGDRVSPIGACLDLHAGQLVDRIGVLLGLPFPAGPAMEALAEDFEARSMIPSAVEGASCHLSGAETKLKQLASALEPGQLAAETYDVLCRTIMKMLDNAARQTGVNEALLFGGVMSSRRLRGLCLERAAKRRSPLKLHFGRPELSGDNAAGVALTGLERMVSHGSHS